MPWNLWEFVRQVPFEADKEPLEFERHNYLVPLYQAINFDPKVNPEGFGLVVMKGAQVGMTITAFAALVMASVKFWGRKFGYFLPTQAMANEFSSDRFAPMLRSNHFLTSLYREESLDLADRKREDRKGLRMIGETSIYFRYMHGKVSTESIPMTGVFFDEVRRMLMPDIERAEERISHSAYPINVKLSTAGYPDVTIDAYFKDSTQHVFHSRCRCKEGIALAWNWPACIGERKGEIFYRCPTCDTRIDEPRRGRYMPRLPEKRTIGFHIPQILSPRQTASTLWAAWLRATDRQEFMNSKLGIAYVDPESILVPEAVAKACVDHEIRWAREGTNCYMGVDQRGGENHVFIADKSQRGKLTIRHLEIVQGDAPFDRLYSLMEQFDVDCCVLDALPSYNEAVRFAKAFRKRVFLAYYVDHLHMIRWSDRDQELRALVKTAKDAKFEFHVMIDRYKAIEYTLMQWVLRHIACPPPEALTQEVLVNGLKRQSQICLGNPDTKEQGLFYHLRSVARRKVEIQHRDAKAGETFETGEFRMEWENIGIDPHFLHADLYCTVAASRRKGGTQLWLNTAPADKTVREVLAEQPALTPTQASDMIQIQQRALPMMQAAEAARPRLDGTCSACRHFDPDRSQCQERHMGTQATFPACEVYEQIEEPA